MAVGLTQPLTEMSTRNLPVDRERLAPVADNLTAILEHTVNKIWEPQRLTTLQASADTYRDGFTCTLLGKALY
jgi:hypothetical protein